MKNIGIKREIGIVLKQLRNGKGLSQTLLANLINCSKMTIIRIENGERLPQPYTLHQMLSALDISHEDFDALLNGTNMLQFNQDFAHIWDVCFAGDYKTMSDMLNELKTKEYCNVERLDIAQALLLCDSIILASNEKYNESLDVLYSALQKTTSKNLIKQNAINCAKVKKSTFSMNEYRILKEIANVKADLGEKQEAIKIFEALMVSLESETANYEIKKKLLPSIYFNMSCILLDDELYTKAFDVIEKGLQFSKITKEFKVIGELIWNKGRVLYNTNNIEQATVLFQQSYIHFVNCEDDMTAKRLKKVAKEKYNITIDN